MYVAIGKEKYLFGKDIVGIFDLDITSQSHITRKYLSIGEKSGKVENAAEDIPKSFVVSSDRRIFLSQMNTATLVKRIEEE